MTSIEDDLRFKVFYSWQSDLPDNSNRRLIRKALRLAANRVETDFVARKLHVEPDEATRGESGSPNIPTTIFEKIRAADAFVCDVTTINSQRNESMRAVPNPNVLIELGFAIAHLGWGRIVLLFNESLGTFPGDLPFDIDRHRASPFEASGDIRPETQEPLAKLLHVALKAIIENNPARPDSADTLPESVIRHQRDVRSLRELLAAVHIQTMDDFFYSIQIGNIPERVIDFWDSFKCTTERLSFHLYDSELSEVVLRLRDHWETSLSFSQFFESNNDRSLYIFPLPADMPLSAEREQAWETIQSAASAAQQAFRELLGIIRHRYLEIDLADTSEEAWKRYQSFQ